jgi:hypothetical protein
MINIYFAFIFAVDDYERFIKANFELTEKIYNSKVKIFKNKLNNFNANYKKVHK